jgi:hypothetical protein
MWHQPLSGSNLPRTVIFRLIMVAAYKGFQVFSLSV